MSRRFGKRALIEDVWPVVSLLLVMLAAVLLASTGSGAMERAGTLMLIYLVVVVGMYVYIGNSGVFSFGHSAFMGVGSYVTAILTMPSLDKEFVMVGLPHWMNELHMAPLPAILIGGLAGALTAALFGITIARMKHLPAALATFAMLAIFYNITSHLEAIGGSSGVSGVPMSTDTTVAFLWAAAAIILAAAYQSTRWCLRLRSSREDEVAARSLGARVKLDRYVALLLSAFIAGVGGGVFATYLGFFNPDQFFLNFAFLTFVMLIVGGTGSLSGAVVGTVVVSAIQEVMRNVEAGMDVGPLSIPARPGTTNLVLGILLIVIIVRRPKGISGSREFSWPFKTTGISWRVTPPAVATAPTPEPSRSD